MPTHGPNTVPLALTEQMVAERGPEGVPWLPLERIGGNVDDPRQADVIFLGESHIDTSHHAAIGHFLDEYTDQDSALVVEDPGVPQALLPEAVHYKYGFNAGNTPVLAWGNVQESVDEAAALEQRAGALEEAYEAALQSGDQAEITGVLERVRAFEEAFTQAAIPLRNVDLMRVVREAWVAGAKRVEIVGGLNHLNDAAFQDFLERHKYMVCRAHTHPAVAALDHHAISIIRDGRWDAIVGSHESGASH